MATQSVSDEARRAPRWIAVAGLAALAWVVGGFASFTWQSTASVLLGGAAVLACGPRGAARPAVPDERPRGTSAWVVWALAFLCLWGSAFLSGSRPSHPTFSLLLDPALEIHPVKAGAFLVWLLVGWALVRR